MINLKETVVRRSGAIPLPLSSLHKAQVIEDQMNTQSNVPEFFRIHGNQLPNGGSAIPIGAYELGYELTPPWGGRTEDPRKIGIGGGPTRATILPEVAAERKKFPIATGFMDYFPDAICAVANLSFVGNEQHNPGKSVRWDRAKSQDEDDTFMRHFMARGTHDIDGIRHSVKMCWRALAFLQKELEAEQRR